MKNRVYIETSVVSYRVAAQSENIRIAGHQIATHKLWEELHLYEVFVSDTVVEEASRGDAIQAKKRLEMMRTFEVLAMSEEVQRLAHGLVSNLAVPKNFPEDALHIACAAVNGLDFIVTWNFKHINNPFMIRRISEVIARAGYAMPVICSPEEFLEGKDE